VWYGGRYAYYRKLKASYRWLYSPKSGLALNPQSNPILCVDPPKVEKKILPSLTVEQIRYLIGKAKCVRDRAIISLFADSGLRLSELADIKLDDIDSDNRLIKVRCKDNKEALAIFGQTTEAYLKLRLEEYNSKDGSIWCTNWYGIE